VSDAGEQVYKEATMASGKVVRDITGFRPGFEYEWDYVPVATINSLVALLKTCQSLTVDYFDTDGTDKQGTFYVSYPSLGVFAFQNNNPVWHNCKLKIMSQGVE
jgi:hypothetical protein